MKANTPRLPVYVAAVCVTAVVFLLCADWTSEASGAEFWNAFSSLLALALAAELLSTKVNRTTSTTAVSFVPFIAAIILLGAPWAMAIAGTTVLVAEKIIRRKRFIKVVHNTSKEVVAIGIAALVYSVLGTAPSLEEFRLDVDGFLLAVGVYFVISNGATATAMALSSGTTLYEAWSRVVVKGFAYDVFASFLALLLAFLYSQLAVLGLVLVIVPLFFVRHTNHINSQLEDTNKDLLELMVKAIEARDPYTSGHSQRVAQLAGTLAREVGLGFKEVEKITTAALLHDVGKIYREFAPILRKEDTLNEHEQLLMESHPGRSAELVSTISSLRGTIEDCVRHHHEHYDGSGYPDGLIGDQIPLGARIVAIADTTDAMTTDRPYRKAMSYEMVLAELTVQAGRQFDPHLVEAIRGSAAIHALVADRSRSAIHSPTQKAGTTGWRLRAAR